MVGQYNKLNSTQNTLQIAEIRDGIVIMNDGSLPLGRHGQEH
jgi:hypothetical protein